MEPRQRATIIVVSILLHVLFFFLWEAGEKLDLFSNNDIPQQPPTPQPIVLDLQRPEALPPQLQQQNIPREVIETPADAKTVKKQDKANFLSDKNALARNPNTNPNLPLGEPFSRGDLFAHELPQPEGPRGKPQVQPTPPTTQNQPPDRKPLEKKPENQAKESDKKSDVKDSDLKESVARISEVKDSKAKDSNAKDSAASTVQPPRQLPQGPFGIQGPPPTVRYDNPESRAEDMGGLSFNTYNWDFAPYLLMLKHRIQNNIFPPPAFYQLGIIDGETLLRFKIFPNGQMKDLEILKYKGHESLMLTSKNAVVSSSPFPGLPTDFPEPYLEVTGKFVYFIRREGNSSNPES